MSTLVLSNLLTGMLLLAYGLAGLFFLKFYRQTRDRFFAIFAVAFWTLMIERVFLVLIDRENEFQPFIYCIRLAAFLLILIAIADKNRNNK